MSLLATPWPTVAIEIAPRRVTVAALRSRVGQTLVRAHATEPLPEGVIRPSLTATNVIDTSRVGQALTTALQSIGGRQRQVGLVVPDSAAKVSLVRFETVPAREEDLRELIGWQVRKSAPFKIEDAQISYTPGAPQPGGGREYVVVLARRDVIEEYENVCTNAGVRAGVVDLATFNLINLVIAGNAGNAGRHAVASGDWLLVHVEADYSTVAIVRGESLVFYRNAAAQGERDLANFVHQTTMYYEDRLGGKGFGRVILAGAEQDNEDAGALHQAVADRVGREVETINPASVATLKNRRRIDPSTLEALASPVGLLVRRRAS